MEELQALGIVHVGGDLRAYLIDVHILLQQLAKDSHGLLYGAFTKVLPDEVLHVVHLRLARPAVGLDDGRGEDKEAYHEAVPLLCG